MRNVIGFRYTKAFYLQDCRNTVVRSTTVRNTSTVSRINRPPQSKALPLTVLFASSGSVALAADMDVEAADVATARVAVMSTPGCPYCKRAKETLSVAGVAYVDVDVGIDPALRQTVRDLSGKRTVPQIFVAGASIGGCDDLLAALADGSFQRRLGPAGSGTGDVPQSSSGNHSTAPSAAAVPLELLTAIRAARRRAAEALQAPDTATSQQQQDLTQLATRLAANPAAGGIVQSEFRLGSRRVRGFTARQLLDWLAGAGTAAAPQQRDAAAAATLAVQLLGANLVVPAAEEAAQAERAAAVLRAAASVPPGELEGAVFMLAGEAPAPVVGQALNTQYQWQGSARPATQVAVRLRGLILALYDKHLSPDGRSVSYGAMRADPAFAEFVVATAELQKVDLAPLSREELIPFAINLYNALVIHALVALGLTRMSAAQRATFFSRTAKYNIGGLDYTADDLENGILRGNRAGAAQLFNLLGLPGLAGGHWRRGDPRLSKVVSPVDPRIHFALVCGARSCPPIKLYAADNLEEGLAAAAEAFCATEVEVHRPSWEVRLSKIFKWYAVDFGATKHERLAYVAELMAEPSRGQLLEMLQEAKAGGGDIRVSYKEYDWSLNGTDQ